MYDPDMGMWQYFYDDSGRLTMQVAPNGKRIDFVYTLDLLGRLTDKYLYTWNPTINNWALTDIVFYDYESDDAAFSAPKGLLYRVWDNAGTERFSYDARGRVLKKERYFYATGESFLTQYTYDDADRVSTVTYPGNIAQVKSSYDTAGHLKKVEALSSPFGPQVFYEATAFTEHDEISTIKWRNNSQTTTTCDFYPASRRLSRIRTTRAGGVLIQDLSYKYDAVANVANIADAINASGNASDSLQNITYDNLDRLKSYTRESQTTTFNYDNIGNIILNEEMGSGQYTYFGETIPHAVWAANGRGYDYDLAGNMVWRNGQTLVYDEQNRLRQVDNVHFFYNDAGERVRKISPAGETVWIDDLYEREPGKTLCHVQADGKRIVTFSADGSEFYYYHSDHLGSSSLMTDQSGSLVRQQYGYRAFGSERFSLSIFPSFTSRFTGQPYDVETGLYYFQSRYYDPELGRFIQPDSIVPDPGSSQSLNRYSYVLNNPLKYIDPTGHAPQGMNLNGPSGGNGSSFFEQSSFWDPFGADRLFWNPFLKDHSFWNPLADAPGRDWLGVPRHRASEAPSSAYPHPYAHWDYSRKPTVGETVRAVASVALLAVPGGAPLRIIGAALRIARVAAAARVGARFGVTRMAPILAKSAGQLGREGEALASGITGAGKNTESWVVNGRLRTPDQVLSQNIVTRNPAHIVEVKNVKYQSLTRQLRDYRDLVGPGGRVDIALPPGARVSRSLQKAFDDPRNPLKRMDLVPPD
jgi:RHS repeat-associated protein